MSFITSLFGGTEGNIVPVLFALGIVIVLIVLAVWLLKFVFNVSTGVGRGRNRRLAVVDTLPLDTKRQLLIIRRDNVEHLILTGGPHDVVVETGIPVEEQAARQPTRRPVPSVPAQRARPPQPAGTPAPAEPKSPPTPAAAVERLREIAKPQEPRSARSLRHTGLLRPVTTQDPLPPGQNPDISVLAPADSAKQGAADQTSQDAAFDDNTSSERDRN